MSQKLKPLPIPKVLTGLTPEEISILFLLLLDYEPALIPKVEELRQQLFSQQNSTSNTSGIISLREFVENMGMSDDMMYVYLNKTTGEFVMVMNNSMSHVEEMDETEIAELDPSDWEQRQLLDAYHVLTSDDFIQLPSQFDLHEYKLMEDFCYAQDDEIAGQLLRTIKGRGAFRRFKDKIFELDVRDDWFAYRDKIFAERAIDWLEVHKIKYKNDMGE